MNVNPADISIAHRIGRKPNGRDRRHIIFKLCRRDLVGDIFEACKATKPPFYINTSLTPLRNKILYGLRLLKRKFPTVVKGCRSTPTGEVTVFIRGSVGQAHRRRSSSSASTSGTLSERSDGAQSEPPTVATIRTTNETDDGAEAASSVSTDMVSRRGDRRIIINTKEQLKKFMTEHLSVPLESLAIDW